MARKSKGKKLKKRTMIFCEGETEKFYFDMLKKKYHSSNVTPVKSEVISGSSVTLVKNAIAKINAGKSKYKYEKIYVVYDKDDESSEDIQKALKEARAENIITLFSNECFELWVLMHFKKETSFKNRKELYKILEKEMNLSESYESIKGEKVAPMLEDLIHKAVENATNQELDDDVVNNINNNPYTNVHHHIKSIYGVDKL